MISESKERIVAATDRVAAGRRRRSYGAVAPRLEQVAEKAREIGMMPRERGATMTKRPRRNHNPAIRAKVAVAAIKGVNRSG